jgi:uncharacterized protein (TIGR02452 family)
MKSREYLIDIFRDTIEKVESGKYKSSLNSEKVNFYTIPVDINHTRFDLSVVNQDCVETARILSKQGKTCLLNMASHRKPGGGVNTGAMAQEEELARRSNLVWGLPGDFYPILENQLIYTYDVDFFKDSQYNEIDPFTCDVITIPAVNISFNKPANYHDLMTKKIEMMLQYPHLKGCKNLVLSAFGCGVFNNNPNYVANLFKDLIYNKYGGLYDNIIFSIINDRNSVGSNYQIFKQVLENV